MTKTTIPRPETPELDRRAAVRGDAEAIGKFIEWISARRDITICEHVPDPEKDWPQPQYRPLRVDITRILEDYFGIDPQKIDAEQRALLEHIRLSQGMTAEGET